MQFLKDAHLNVKHHFEKGGKLEFFYPLWEAQFTGLFTPGSVTRTASHVRDGIDNKRLMITVLLISLTIVVTLPIVADWAALDPAIEYNNPIAGYWRQVREGVQGYTAASE